MDALDTPPPDRASVADPPPVRPAGMPPRALGAVMMVAGLLPLGIGAGLTPSGQGVGTHTQMGLPSCSWVVAFEKPCPTCGMTTAVTHAVHGELWSSFLTQPAGFVFAILAACAFWCGLHGLASGANTVRLAGSLFKGRTLWLVGGILLAAWAYKLISFKDLA